jgi:hypothetical protein
MAEWDRFCQTQVAGEGRLLLGCLLFEMNASQLGALGLRVKFRSARRREQHFVLAQASLDLSYIRDHRHAEMESVPHAIGPLAGGPLGGGGRWNDCDGGKCDRASNHRWDENHSCAPFSWHGRLPVKQASFRSRIEVSPVVAPREGASQDHGALRRRQGIPIHV